MNFKQLLEDDNAVSPVIGVILMVAITVILAAVIGTFVLGLGDQVSNTSPQASFSFDFQDETDTPSDPTDVLEITHDGGDKISASQLTVSTQGTGVDLAASQANIDAADTSTSESFTDTDGLGSSADVSAGTTVYVGPGDDSAELNGETIRVTWQSSNGDDTATLGKWTGPNA